jgi:uncharacterized membrane protein
MTDGRRIVVAAAGVVLVVLGLALAFLAGIYLSPDNGGDGIWDWNGNVRLGHTLGAIGVVLICGGFAAVAGAVFSYRAAGTTSGSEEDPEHQ